MNKCICEFAGDKQTQECQLHKEMRMEISRLKAQQNGFDQSCLENYLLDAIKAWFGGSGLAQRRECLEALSTCTVAVLMSDKVLHPSELN